MSARECDHCHGCGGRSDDTDDSVGDLVACDWCEPTRMLCHNCAHSFDEEPEHGTTLNSCGECAAKAEIADMRESMARLRAALTYIRGIGSETACLPGKAFEWAACAADQALAETKEPRR